MSPDTRRAAAQLEPDPRLPQGASMQVEARAVRLARAEQIFRELPRLHPHYRTAQRNLAILLRKQGRDAEADALAAEPAAGA